MKNKLLVICLLFLFISNLSHCQGDDFGIWYGINTEYSLSKKFDIKVSALTRTFNNASKIEQAYLEGGGSFKLNKYVSFAGAYRFTENIEDDSKYHPRHKWLADIKGDGDLGSFNFSGRFRFQKQTKTYFDNHKDEIPDYYGRIKFKTTFKTPSFPINPSISFETFCRMFEITKKRFDKHRFSVGMEYKIKKKQSIDVLYMFQRDYLPHLADMHIISVEYNLKF